jgi:triacylglycerol lipase
MSMFVQLPPEKYDKKIFDRFSAQRGRFDIDDARAMMWMSQLSYETGAPDTIREIAAAWNLKPRDPIRARGMLIDTRVIIGERPDCTIVAFAGTDPALASNLITDVRVRLTSSDTHEGFQKAFDAAWDEIKPAIENSTRPLFFTGHSLGAALAVLAAEKACDSGMMPAAVYTFGMPRAGGAIFAARYNEKLGDRTFRLVHGGDIVPCIPEWFARLLPPGRFQFQHVGQMLRCDSGTKFDRLGTLSPMTANDPAFRAGLRENWINRRNALLAGQLFAAAGPGRLGRFLMFLPFAIRDHLPDRYRSALES